MNSYNTLPRKTLASALALTTAIGLAACSSERNGTVSNMKVVVKSEPHYSDDGHKAAEQFGITANYALDGENKAVTSQVLVGCVDPVLTSKGKRGAAIIIRAETLLGDRKRLDTLQDDHIAVQTGEDCQDVFGTIGAEDKALKYLDDSLNGSGRKEYGDGFKVQNPNEESKELLKHVVNYDCPITIDC